MTNELSKNPSQIAFEKLKELISKDENLDENIVAAILEDISTTDPHELKFLKETINQQRGESSDDSNNSAQSK